MRYGRFSSDRERKRYVWGVVLISVGLIMLLGQLGFSGVIPDLTWWPGILFIIGGAQVFTASGPKGIASGVSLMLMSIWFFACVHHWYGLSYRTAWPLVLVIFGAEMIFGALLERMAPNEPPLKKEEHHA